jgi:N-acetylmuramoyl-L-alanine amidase
VVVIDPGHGGLDNGTQAGGEMEKNLVLGFGWRCATASRNQANTASS